MIHSLKQEAQDFPYLQKPNVGNIPMTPAEKAITRATAAARLQFVDGVWVVVHLEHYPNGAHKVRMTDTWKAGVCGHYDPDFVCRAIIVEGDFHRVVYDMRFPSEDSVARWVPTNFAPEIMHPIELTRIWVDIPRTVTTVDAITLFK